MTEIRGDTMETLQDVERFELDLQKNWDNGFYDDSVGLLEIEALKRKLEALKLILSEVKP
jgi:hypothetical protein